MFNELHRSHIFVNPENNQVRKKFQILIQQPTRNRTPSKNPKFDPIFKSRPCICPQCRTEEDNNITRANNKWKCKTCDYEW